MVRIVVSEDYVEEVGDRKAQDSLVVGVGNCMRGKMNALSERIVVCVD